MELLDGLGHAIAKVAALNILQKSLAEDEAAPEGPNKQTRIAASLRGCGLERGSGPTESGPGNDREGAWE